MKIDSFIELLISINRDSLKDLNTLLRDCNDGFIEMLGIIQIPNRDESREFFTLYKNHSNQVGIFVGLFRLMPFSNRAIEYIVEQYGLPKGFEKSTINSNLNIIREYLKIFSITDDDLRNLRAEIKEFDNKRDLIEDYSRLKFEKNELNNTLKELQNNYNRVNSEIESVKSNITKIEKDIKDLEKQKKEKEREKERILKEKEAKEKETKEGIKGLQSIIERAKTMIESFKSLSGGRDIKKIKNDLENNLKRATDIMNKYNLEEQ